MVENCTIAGNYAYVEGGGVYVGGGTDRLINCIIYSNTCNQASRANFFIEKESPAFTNCCLTPALPAENDDYATGIITASPLFADADYRLGRLSPCVDYGVNDPSWMAGALDLDGRARINPETGAVDLGCYEFYPVGTVLLIR